LTGLPYIDFTLVSLRRFGDAQLAADLGRLEKSFKWEIRVLYLIPPGVILYLTVPPVGILYMGVATLGILASDTVVSVAVVAAFLRPIRQTLRQSVAAHGGDRTASLRSPAAKRIERTKWTTLAGATIAVISSTVLYINVILWAAMPDTFTPSPWLYPFVFMGNLDSVLNDFGMLLVSGLLSPVSFQIAKRSVISRKSSRYSNTDVNLARSKLETVSSIPLSKDFAPPQEQPRGRQFKKIAQVLEEGSFPHAATKGEDGIRAMDEGVSTVIDDEFGPAVQAYILEYMEVARGLVQEMRDQYHGVRRSHLVLYKDTLDQIRKEASFPELQRRSEALVSDCAKLKRPLVQSVNTISGLYRTAEAVAKRYNKLLKSVGDKIGAIFHKAPRKGLTRITEKLGLTPGENNWKPERVSDVVRGAIECKDFTTMINALRMFRDLDTGLCVTGETGGIAEKICITRAKDRFGTPTSGGWADIMLNFHFENDEGVHICEVQLVHSQMFTMRKNMGAHKTYSVFRAALELLEMLGLDPEDGGSEDMAVLLRSLPWMGTRQDDHGQGAPLGGGDVKNEVRALQAALETQVGEVAALKAQSGRWKPESGR
jgi:hypothetical protein